MQDEQNSNLTAEPQVAGSPTAPQASTPTAAGIADTDATARPNRRAGHASPSSNRTQAGKVRRTVRDVPQELEESFVADMQAGAARPAAQAQQATPAAAPPVPAANAAQAAPQPNAQPQSEAVNRTPEEQPPRQATPVIKESPANHRPHTAVVQPAHAKRPPAGRQAVPGPDVVAAEPDTAPPVSQEEPTTKAEAPQPLKTKLKKGRHGQPDTIITYIRPPKPHLAWRICRGVLRVLGAVVLVAAAAVGLIYGAVTMLSFGPFPTARDLFVVSVEETSAIKFMSRIHLSEDEVQTILAANRIVPATEVTDVTEPFAPPDPETTEEKDIEIYDVSGNTFVGLMMVVKDPSRVQLETLDQFGGSLPGKRIDEFASEYGATAAINAGFFDDPGGVGKGGQPLGIYIKDGKIVNGSAGMVSSIVGFTDTDHLVVGRMSGQEALDMGIRDCVTVEPSIMPTLVVNGNPAEINGNGGGLNPRTAIGQRADGAVLMLVIDGRQPHSLGATLQDCQKLMLEYGAVDASNMDGGLSSVMVYEGETINVVSSLFGSRKQPSAWLVY